MVKTRAHVCVYVCTVIGLEIWREKLKQTRRQGTESAIHHVLSYRRSKEKTKSWSTRGCISLSLPQLPSHRFLRFSCIFLLLLLAEKSVPFLSRTQDQETERGVIFKTPFAEKYKLGEERSVAGFSVGSRELERAGIRKRLHEWGNRGKETGRYKGELISLKKKRILCPITRARA